jgi:hypothetical protein
MELTASNQNGRKPLKNSQGVGEYTGENALNTQKMSTVNVCCGYLIAVVRFMGTN